MENNFTQIPFKIHPRAFAALGLDLVTSDIVAIIELVKNSYDAFSENVSIRFGKDHNGKSILEIEDDGRGMSKDVLTDVWCTVATPFKVKNKTIKNKGKERLVTGEKGLGRLSAARLGNQLKMLTKASRKTTLELTVNWNDLTEKKSINDSFVRIRELPNDMTFKDSGTLLVISDLNSEWNENSFLELEDNLSRLLSPFSKVDDFKIFLYNGIENSKEIKVQIPKILSEPMYKIKGEVTEKNEILYTYEYKSLEGEKRIKKDRIQWKRICEETSDKIEKQKLLSLNDVNCGNFSFEIRAWDLNQETTEKLEIKYGIKRSKIRAAIKAHKGITVYRDSVLVLPKSEEARDWLGLDLRRVSRVGQRLSTHQIMGYVDISLEKNPGIKDTSSREKLVQNPDAQKFQQYIKEIVILLEEERNFDKAKPAEYKTTNELFKDLNLDKELEEIREMVSEGATSSEIIINVEKISEKIGKASGRLQENFVYYNQLATIGSIALFIVHEIRNRTTALGSLFRIIEEKFLTSMTKQEKDKYYFASSSIESLESLADSFAPLANKKYRKRGIKSNFKEVLDSCLRYYENDFRRNKIKISVNSEKEFTLDVEPADLSTILINLIVNANHWLSVKNDDLKQIIFSAKDNKNGFVEISVSDSGAGIEEGDEEKIFLPGVTRRKDGMGMGLTVASELVARYGGKMKVSGKGKLGGATFIFTIPISG